MAGQRQENGFDLDDSKFLASLELALGHMKIKSEASLVTKGVEVANSAKRYCPVATGRLRSAISFDAEAKHDDKGAYVEVGVKAENIGTPTNYALPVEFGTEHMRAQPFMRPALAELAGFEPGGVS